ncbi:MAG: hypothetical protein GX096_15435 [Clostridiales bacterium]|nr:hypothetical protein [Clostridiales bacterium]
MKKSIAFLLISCLLLALIPTAVAANNTFTLMIYLCGTDLESNGAFASKDLGEIFNSGIPSDGDLTVYIQTGGTKSWQTRGITDRKVERWTIDKEGMARVDSVGTADMGSVDTFADFLTYGFDNFPADRYGLVMWDHGSGASGGLCYDELTKNSLFYPDIYEGLNYATAADNYKKFEFIGFDACLMASYELAIHIAPFARYMIASEELEPGGGWAYNGWLPALASNPGINIETLGKKIVDSFLSTTLAADSSDYATLSVCDLSKLKPLVTAVEGFATSLSSEVNGSNFSTISRLRQNMRSFGEYYNAASDMVDMTVFANAYSQFDSSNAKKITAALDDVVVYSKHTNNLSNVSGLSILVPFSTRNSASTYLNQYKELKLSPSYSAFVSDMLSTTLSGSSSSSGSTLSSLFGIPSVSQQSIQSAQIDWFSQYSTDETSYTQQADSLWGDLFGTSYEEDNSSDFSLDSFLGMLFGTEESTASYDQSYDTSSSSLWGSLTGESDLSFTTDSGYGSGLWGSSLISEEIQTELPQTSNEITLETESGNVTLDNPFADTQSEYAYTAQLTSDQMDVLGKVEANLMMDVSDPDFECYVELGYVQDVVVDWNRGKIYGMFDGAWATLDGQMVCIYDQIANERYIRSLIPVTLNGEESYLLVIFDEETPGGRIVGWTEGYGENGLPVRGYNQLQKGDEIIPQYELIYWDADGDQQIEPFEGDPITIGKSASVDFSFQTVEADADYCYCFCLTDIYGDSTFTEYHALSF